MKSLCIAVVGSGIAGAAAALFLRRTGHCVIHFEQSEATTSSGAGLLLQPPALAVLRAANLDDELWALGERVDYISAYFSASQQTIRLAYSEFDSNTHACGIHRGALLNILRSANDGMNEIHWSSRVVQVDAEAGLVLTADGKTFGPFELIVAADGAKSIIRAQFPKLVSHDRSYETAALVCLIDNSDVAFRYGVQQRFHGRTHVSTWPVGTQRAGDVNRLTIAMRANADELSRFIEQPGEWLRHLRQIHPTLADLVYASPCQPELLSYCYRDVATRSYYTNRVVLIGDAAHAMSPQLGLGASMGLLDAWYLAKCLSNRKSVGESLVAFDGFRRPDVTSLQQLSRLITPLFQSNNRAVAALRERSTLIAGRSDALKRLALEALCNVPQGLI